MCAPLQSINTLDTGNFCQDILVYMYKLKCYDEKICVQLLILLIDLMHGLLQYKITTWSVWEQRKQNSYSDGSANKVGRINPTSEYEVNVIECYGG